MFIADIQQLLIDTYLAKIVAGTYVVNSFPSLRSGFPWLLVLSLFILVFAHTRTLI